MLSRTGLQSYAVQSVKGKAVIFLLLSFLAAKGHSAAVSRTRRSLSLNNSFQISIQLSQTPWSEDFFNNRSAEYISLAANLETAVLDVVKKVGNGEVKVLEFKPGSVIAVIKITASSSDEKGMKTQLESEMKDRELGGYSVDPILYSGRVFEVILKMKFPCNESLPDKGFLRKDELMKTINTEMSGNAGFLNATIYSIECSQADNITLVTTRVQIKDSSATNPFEELSSLKTQVDTGKLGSFSVIPEWRSYIPGEKVFYVSVELQTASTNATQTKEQLKKFIENDFKDYGNFRYVHVVMPDSNHAVMEIGMRSSTSPILFMALSPIGNELSRGNLGGVKVNKKQNRVTIDIKSLTRKIFEVSFIKYVPSCVEADLTDTNSSHYKELGQKFTHFINTNMKAHSLNSKFYLSNEVTKLECKNSTSVKGYNYVYMKPSTEDKIANLNGALYKCSTEPGIYDNGLKISLRTPTTPEAKGTWSWSLAGVSLTRGSCLRPKPTNPTNGPTPTIRGTTTGRPSTTQTNSKPSTAQTTGKPSTTQTTGKPTTAQTTGTPTTTPNLPSTKPQAPITSKATVKSESTVPPTTEIILPMLPSETELYAKVKFGMTWEEFCSKQDSFKEIIAWNVRDKNDSRVSPDRIIYVNVERNCVDPSKKKTQAEVGFYVSEPDSSRVNEYLTFKVYRLFKMFFGNGNTKQLGSEFQEKVLHVELGGSHASKYEKDSECKWPLWLLILLAVAGAIGLFLIILACCCLFCCGGRWRRRRRKYDADQPQALVVVHVDSNGSVRCEQKNGKQNYSEFDTTKTQDGDDKHLKDDSDKEGYYNGGFDSDAKNKNYDGNDNHSSNARNEGKSPQSKTKSLSDGSGNTYQSLSKTDGVGDYTYRAIDKSGRTTTGQIDNDKNNNPSATMAHLSSDSNQVLRSGESGSSDINSRKAGNNTAHAATVIPPPSIGGDKATPKEGDASDLNLRRAGNKAAHGASVIASPSTRGEKVIAKGGDGKDESEGSLDLISRRAGSYTYAAHVTTVTTTSTGGDEVKASGGDGKGKSDVSPDLYTRRADSYVYSAHVTTVTTTSAGGDKGTGRGGNGSNKSGGSSNHNSSRVGNKKDITPLVNMSAPLIGGRSRGTGANAGDGSNKDADGFSSRADKNGESQDSYNGSKASPNSFLKTDTSPKDGARRGSRVRSSIDEEVPLTHKTGTVGIVALALRNKNETKKEREFKNLDKDVPKEEMKYPPDTTNKNRSPEVLPAPRTRVKLSSSPDYINANWIRDHKGQVCYIATQHPMTETVRDFWQMVWDQRVQTVVMVNDEEKEKPAEFVDYIPKGEGTSRQFGGFSVTVKQVTEKPDFVMTVLSIVEGKNAASSREVTHLKFTSWKERTMPNVALFVGFVTATQEARKKYDGTKAPTLVHCSDGLGFTGVYIAVDIGVKSHEENKTSVVDVFELSKNLRRDRHAIVCTLEHYNFIYQALYEYTVNYDKSAE